MNNKNLEYYLNLNYRIKVEPHDNPENGSYWTAEYVLLKGCKTEGDTKAEAISNVKELFEEYIIDRLEIDDNIPEPELLSPQTLEPDIWIELPPHKLDRNINDETLETVTDPDLPLYQYPHPQNSC